MARPAKLRLFDLTMIVVSLVIGMGIFRTPVTAAAKAGTPTIFFLAWITGGLIALCGALTYAEIGSRYPVTGGYFKIFSYGYHPSFAFAVNCIILVSNAASTAAVGVIGAEYIGHFFYSGPVPATFKQLVTIGAVSIFYLVNLLGLRMSSRIQSMLTLIKISLILLLIASLAGRHPLNLPAASAPLSVNTGTAWGFLRALGISLIAVSFTYGGYQQTINFGAEVDSPGRTIPKGIGFGVLIIILLYLSINFAYTQVIGFNNLRQADSIAALLIRHLLGPGGEDILRILMFLSVLAYVNVLLMSNPRVMFAMSEEGILPSVFRRKTQKHGAIVYSLTAFSVAIILTLFFTSTFEKILNYAIFLDSIGMATSAAALFMLRKRRVGEDREIFRSRLYPWSTLIFILAYFLVAMSIVRDDPHSALYGVLIFVGFFVLYFVRAAVYPRRAQT